MSPAEMSSAVQMKTSRMILKQLQWCLVVMSCGCGGSLFSLSPCSDNTWAGWRLPSGVVWVSPTGDDTNRGSVRKPLRTIRAAMEAVRGSKNARIGLLPGVHEGGVRVFRDSGKPITIAGCSAEEVVIQGSSDKPATPTLSLQGSGEVEVRDLSIESGSVGLTITGGVQASVASVTVNKAQARGIIIGGEKTTAALTDVLVQSTEKGIGRRPAGWGIGIIDAQVTLSGVQLLDNSGFGLNMDGGRLSAQQLVVEQTRTTDSGRFGTGIYVRHAEQVSLSECAVRDNTGDGIFLIDNQEVEVRDCVIDGTMSSSQAGDGLVVRQVGTAVSPQVTLSGNVITNTARLGLAVAGPLTASLTNNEADTSNGVAMNGHSRFATDNATVTGDETHHLDLDEYGVGRQYRTPR